jgi:hypothetical protein
MRNGGQLTERSTRRFGVITRLDATAHSLELPSQVQNHVGLTRSITQLIGSLSTVVMPASPLALVAPWLAVIGLVGCIGTVAVIAKKRK